MKEKTNVTLSMPDTLLRRFRILAASRNESMSNLMTMAVRQMIDQDTRVRKARRSFLDRIRSAPDRGTRGAIAWKRDELHER